jgi:hypothetical protein
VRPSTQFLRATAALCVAAGLDTLINRFMDGNPTHYPIFDRLFLFYDCWLAALQMAIVVLVWSVPAVRRAGAALATTLGAHPRRAAAATVVVLALAARFVYRATPFAMDEYAPLAQSFAFAHGRLTWFVPVELVDRMIPFGFRDYFMAVDPATGEMASMYWPGFAALLAPFTAIGLPWLLNPLLAGLAVLLIHRLAQQLIGGREAAGWAILFALASPVFTVNAISFYSMTAHLALNLLFLLWLLDGRMSRAFLAGLTGGLALNLHNPVPHVLFAAPWLAWLAWDRRRWPALAAVAVGYVPIGLGVGLTWPLLLGALHPHTAKAAAVIAPTAGLWALVKTKFGAAFALPNMVIVVARLQATWKIWIWSFPGLLILTAAAARRANPRLLLLGGSALVTYVVYWFVPFDQGHGWGYRYLHSAWAALPLLAAAFIVAPRQDPEDARGWREQAGGLAIASLVLGTALAFAQVRAVMGQHLAQRIPIPASGRWIEFVRFDARMYTWDMIQNMPGDSRRLILMSFGAPSDTRLVSARYPGAHLVREDLRGSLWSLPP